MAIDTGASFTVTDALRRNVMTTPDKRAFVMTGKSLHTEEISFSELDARAQQIAVTLGNTCREGDRVIIMFPSGLDFVTSFFGVLYAGMIAVPVYIPRKNNLSERIDLIAADCSATVLLTSDKTLTYLQKNFPDFIGFTSLQIITLEMIGDGNMLANYATITSDTIAFLQYTSGSTGQPKGVIVTHGNLTANLLDLYAGSGQHVQSIMVSWLPVFHDLGLIAGILLPVFGGFTCFLMAPADFIVKPLRWIQLLSTVKATHTVAPNFAFDLCIKAFKKEELGNTDLSQLQYMGNCAEPVQPATIAAFVKCFGAYGLSENTIKPGYGLAEATLKVSSVAMDRSIRYIHADNEALLHNKLMEVKKGDKKERILVGCGSVAAGTTVMMVNPETLCMAGAGEIGEIWLRGPSVAKGYWNNPVLTNAVFKASPGGSKGAFYLRTGDLGIVHHGQLFITGRLKDIIIIRGENHYPQDIELTIEQAHKAIRKGHGAVFSVDKENVEQLVVVYELYAEYLHAAIENEIITALVKSISMQHGLQVYAITLLVPSGMPITSSGKVRRGACKEQFLQSGFGKYERCTYVFDKTATHSSVITDNDIEANAEQVDYITALVTGIAQKNFGISNVDLKQSIYQLGIDSITAVRAVYELEEILQLSLSPTIFFEVANLQGLIELLSTRLNEKKSETALPYQSLTDTSFPEKVYNNPKADLSDDTLDKLESLSEQELDLLLTSLGNHY